MKSKAIIRTIVIVFITIMIMASTAFAGTSISSGNSNMPTNDSDLANRLRNVPDFKFKNHENGIGYGNCPVYTAPSEEAFRCADGKASCYTDAYMSEAGSIPLNVSEYGLFPAYTTGCRVLPPETHKRRTTFRVLDDR